MTTTVLEMVTFERKAEVTDAQWLATNAEVEPFLRQQQGFHYRSLSKDEAGLWYDVVYWQDMDCAKKASEAFIESDVGKALCGMINMDSCKMRHMSVEVEMMGCEG